MDRLPMGSLEFFDAAPVFTRDEFVESRGQRARGDRSAEALLAYHVSKGRILRIRRGLYASVPRGIRVASFTPDPYLVASRVAANGVIAYHTALELRGTAQSVFRRLTIASR